MFKDKIIKLITEVAETIGSESYDNNPAPKNIYFLTKEKYIKNRLDLILEKMNANFKELKGKIERKQNEIDSIIGSEEMVKKMEEIRPRIEEILLKINQDLIANGFNNWVDSFYIENIPDNEIHVIFKKDLSQNPFAKYFSFTINSGYDSSGAKVSSTYENLSYVKIIENISTLEKDEVSAGSELSQKKSEQIAFSKKGFIARFSDKGKGKEIDTKVRELEEKIKNLTEAKRLLLSLANFTNKMNTILKDEPIRSLRFDDIGNKKPQTFGTLFMREIDEYTKQLKSKI